MKRMLSWVAAAAVTVASGAQAQDETITFRPNGNWTADYGDDYCRLIRTFSDGQREMSLALERLQPGAFVRIIVVGEGLRPFRNAEQIAYAFQPSGSSGKARYVRSDTADGKQFVSFDPVTLAQFTFTPGAPPPKARIKTAEGAFVRNEFFEAEVDAATGGLRAFRDTRTRINRLGMYPVFNPGSKAVAKSVQVTAAGASFFFKQRAIGGIKVSLPELDGRQWAEFPS